MSFQVQSPCKVNLLLNILSRRSDGFHELETIMQPVACHDHLTLDRQGEGLHLTCSVSELPTDHRNLVYRAAEQFLHRIGRHEGLRIHLEKRLPMAAGLGGGSANAAATLLGLNRLFENPLSEEDLSRLAGTLGSDVPFFLQNNPALATGRGERVQSLAPFPALRGCHLLLAYPGFGVSTPWAYQQLARFPNLLPGQTGRAQKLLVLLQGSDPAAAAAALFNSLEHPVFEKYPALELMKEFFLDHGALGALMSGSGSTMFAILGRQDQALSLKEKLENRFRPAWTVITPL